MHDSGWGKRGNGEASKSRVGIVKKEAEARTQ